MYTVDINSLNPELIKIDNYTNLMFIQLILTNQSLLFMKPLEIKFDCVFLFRKFISR